MAKSRGRKFAEITSPTSGVFDLTSVPTITNAKLQNSAMTLAGSSVSLGGTGVANTDALSEGSSNLYFTNARVQSFLGGGTLAGNIVVPDNISIYLGSNSDFRLVHNNTNTQLINATGELQITSNGGVAVTGNTTIRSGNKLILNRADNATGGEITYGPTGTGFIFNDVNGDDIIFKTGSTEHMRIDAATSRVGIGEDTPATTLDVDGILQLRGSGYATYATRIYTRLDSTHASVIESYLNNSTAFEMMGTYADSGGSNPRIVIGAGGQKVGIGATNPNTNLQLYHATDDISINVNHGTGGSYPKKSGISFGATSTSLGGDATFTGGAGIQVTNTAASNNPTEMSFFTTSGGTPTTRLTIDSSGQVGIGATNPGQTLEIHNSNASDYTDFGLRGTGHKYVIGVGNASVSTVNDKWYLYDNDNSAFRMVVDTSGNVGIGQTNPSAKLDVVGGGGSTAPTLELNSSTSNVFNHAVNAFNSNLTAGENNISIIGKEGSTKNSGYIGYKWNGAASNTNLLTFGHWSSDNLMNLTADGRLGIGTQTPASYDTDSGGISADLVVVNSGHAGIIVASGTGSDAGIFFGDGTGNAAYRGAVSYVNSQDRLYFKASGGNFLTLDNTKLNAANINLDVGVDTSTVNFTDSVSNTHTKYIEIGANGSTSLGDALLVTHSAGSGVGYFGYESGNDRLIIACDNGGGNNTIEFSVNAGTATGGTTDNLNGATAALTIGGDEVVTTAKHVRQSGAPGFKVKNHGFTKGTGWTHIGASITTVDYNNNSSGWSSSNGRFTPTRAGYYLFSFGGWANASTNGARYATSFAKNNSLTYISGGDYCSVDSPLNGHSEVIYMNGSTDYVQLYAYSAISCTWGTTSHAAWWSAMWLH